MVGDCARPQEFPAARPTVRRPRPRPPQPPAGSRRRAPPRPRPRRPPPSQPLGISITSARRSHEAGTVPTWRCSAGAHSPGRTEAPAHLGDLGGGRPAVDGLVLGREAQHRRDGPHGPRLGRGSPRLTSASQSVQSLRPRGTVVPDAQFGAERPGAGHELDGRGVGPCPALAGRAQHVRERLEGEEGDAPAGGPRPARAPPGGSAGAPSQRTRSPASSPLFAGRARTSRAGAARGRARRPRCG